MANYKATGKKTKHGAELVQRCRAAVLNTFNAIEKEGKLISEILAEEFKSNPLRFMDMASKYCPKEIDGEITHVFDAAELTDDELKSIAARGRTRAAKAKSGKTQSTPLH